LVGTVRQRENRIIRHTKSSNKGTEEATIAGYIPGQQGNLRRYTHCTVGTDQLSKKRRKRYMDKSVDIYINTYTFFSKISSPEHPVPARLAREITHAKKKKKKSNMISKSVMQCNINIPQIKKRTEQSGGRNSKQGWCVCGGGGGD
jgi:hypothetical protein